jgi:hypothetical protein
MDGSTAELAGGERGVGNALPSLERPLAALTLVVVGQHEDLQATESDGAPLGGLGTAWSIAHGRLAPGRGLFDCGPRSPLLPFFGS